MIILNIGKNSYAMGLPMNLYPLENSKYKLETKNEGSSGTACNTAYLLAKWHVDSTYSGMIAYDNYGTIIKKELESVGVDTSNTEIAYEKETPLEISLLNEANHSITEFLVAKEPFFLKKNEFNKIPDIIFTDGHEYSTSISAINKFKNAKSILGVSELTKESLEIAKQVNFIIFSLNFVENYTKLKADFNQPLSLLAIYKKVKERYSTGELIITLNQYGVMYAINDDVRVMPPIQVDIKDVRGNVDVFKGSFAYCISKNYDLEKAIRFSSIASSLSMRKLGIKPSFPELMEVIENYERRFGSLDNQELNQNEQEVAPVTNNTLTNEPLINSTTADQTIMTNTEQNPNSSSSVNDNKTI